jgi:hypothetical protein
LAKVTGPNQFSLTVGHQTTAEVDEVTAWAGFTVLTYFKIYTLQIIIFIATVVALHGMLVLQELKF